MKVLVSGFEAFGEREMNPTSLLVAALKRNEIPVPDGMTVDQILLPVTFSEAFEVLQERIDEFNPDVVMSLGLASKRGTIDLETTALNRIHAEIPDNLGLRPQNTLINPAGPPCYLSTLPLQGFEGALVSAGIPVKSSNSAGEYVCNYLFYRLMETNQDSLRLCGFIHFPLLDEQARPGETGLSYGDMKRALAIMLNYLRY